MVPYNSFATWVIFLCTYAVTSTTPSLQRSARVSSLECHIPTCVAPQLFQDAPSLERMLELPALVSSGDIRLHSLMSRTVQTEVPWPNPMEFELDDAGTAHLAKIRWSHVE